MKRYSTIAIVLLIVIGSCTEKKPEPVQPVSEVKPVPLLDSMIKGYIKEYSSAYGYAVYIDKTKTVDKFTIALFREKPQQWSKTAAVACFMLNDTIPFFVYGSLDNFKDMCGTGRVSPDQCHSRSLIITRDTSYIIDKSPEHIKVCQCFIKPELYNLPTCHK